MRIRRFIMEDWLAAYKDSCRFDLGESGLPDITLGELLARCGLGPDSLAGIVLKDHDTRGTGRLRAAIASTYAPPVGFGHITATTGTSEALFILFNILNDDRRSIVVPRPAFQALTDVPAALGLEIRSYILRKEDGWLPDPDTICALIDDSTRAVVINTPHNPSGVFFPRGAVEMVIRKAALHGAFVVSDEHYRFLPLDGASPAESLARPDENVIATGSLTKCFGVIGLRVGWIAAPAPVIEKVRDFRDYLTHTLSPVSDFLASAALEHAAAFIEPARARLRENRESLLSFADSVPGVSLVAPKGGVVAFPAYEYPVSAEMFARDLIERHGVFILPGSSFGMEGCFRINLGGEPSSFREALGLIEEYCRTLR